jgi:FkbM family methyltransferase
VSIPGSVEDIVCTFRLYRPLRNLYHVIFNRAELAGRSHLREFTRQFVKPGDLVFDIGANQGRWTETYHELHARVVAVEPNSVLAQKVRRRYRPLAVVDKALGEDAGEAVLHLGRSSGHSTLSSEWMDAVRGSDMPADRWSGTVNVNVETLDTLVSRYGLPDVVKIDVEGAEAAVLRGLSIPIPFVYFEFQCPYLEAAQGACSRLEELGDYECNYSVVQNHHWELAEWVPIPALLERIRIHAEHNPSDFGDIFARDRARQAQL